MQRAPETDHAGITDATLQRDKATGNRRLPIRESTREKGWSLGCRAHIGEDVRMPVAVMPHAV